MKTDIKLMEIKGLKTPDFTELKGDAYRNAMNEIHKKVEKKRQLRNNSLANVRKIKEQINKIKHQIIMAEDEHEELELKAKRKQLQNELDNIDDYSGLDVDAYAKKLINNEKITNLKQDAQKEHQEIVKVAAPYVEELEKQYNQSRKLLNQFNADYRSESSYRQAASKYNIYKNN